MCGGVCGCGESLSIDSNCVNLERYDDEISYGRLAATKMNDSVDFLSSCQMKKAQRIPFVINVSQSDRCKLYIIIEINI